MPNVIEHEHQSIDCGELTDLATLDNGSLGWAVEVFGDERCGNLLVRDFYHVSMSEFAEHFAESNKVTNEPSKVTEDQLSSWISYYDMRSQFEENVTDNADLMSSKGFGFCDLVIDAIITTDASDWQVRDLASICGD